MCLEDRKIDIKHINEAELIRNKRVLIDLLKDNLKINFPNINNVTEFAINGYEDMVRFTQDNSAILIGAFERGRIIGFLWAYKRIMLGENRIHIGHIIVSSEARSSGIGSKLLKNLEDLSKDKGVKKVELMTTIENENTMKFYKSNGFSIVRVQLEKELGEINDNR